MSGEEFAREFLGGRREPDAKRIVAGLKARFSGEDFEAALETTHQVYAHEGVALLEKLPVATAPMPKAWLSPAGRSRAGICRILCQRARFDYYGTLGPEAGGGRNGRAVAIEAKHSQHEAPSLPIVEGTMHRGLAVHQLKACAEAAARFGTLACVVWKAADHRVLFPPSVLIEAVRENWRALPAVDGLPYRVRVWNGRRLEDWWPALEQWLAKWGTP